MNIVLAEWVVYFYRKSMEKKSNILLFYFDDVKIFFGKVNMLFMGLWSFRD